ncbi:hypothetical protein Vadar_031403 [Vaccinium darrowii]|uniref:Uncharacterized protein n=1 Tax=Vaccinium darrowii TaxID=229202 RepID=A0ACB7Y370_9ERIC|nr:hypothetical protein Vadar_031403 [Vaccinium darrowii]
MENNGTITLRKTLCPNPQRGRCICFRTFYPHPGDVALDVVKFYSIPFDFFGDSVDDDEVNSSDPDVEVLLPFCTTTALSRFSRLSSVGSSLFVVDECRGLRTYEGILHWIDTTAPADGWSAIPMLVPRELHLTVVMDGKLYVFGGNLCAPLAELFDPRSVPSTSLPLHPPPCFPSDPCFNLVIAALQPSKKILVASADVAFVFNVVDQVWEELDHKVDFSRVRGKAAVFRNGTSLCWCSLNAEELLVYDLVLRRWFKSPIKGLDKICYREPDLCWNCCLLFPLDDNHLCLLWQDDIHYDDTILSLFHCAKIRVSIYTGAQGESRFDAVVVASRYYAPLGRDEHLVDAHVFLGEEDEGGERGTGLVGHDHGSWERCGYGSGRRTASSIAPYKKCSNCSLPGHMERDCKSIPCFRCGVMGHTASDCWIVGGGRGGGGGGWNWNSYSLDG